MAQNGTSKSASAALSEIDLHSFTKASVASLVARDIEAIRPHDPRDRRGFKRVVELLDSKVKALLEQNAAAEAVLPLLTVANELRPGNTGAFEFTSSPNPWYDDIEFPVSQTQAESFMSLLPHPQRQLAIAAADAFIRGRGESVPQTDVSR